MYILSEYRKQKLKKIRSRKISIFILITCLIVVTSFATAVVIKVNQPTSESIMTENLKTCGKSVKVVKGHFAKYNGELIDLYKEGCE